MARETAPRKASTLSLRRALTYAVVVAIWLAAALPVLAFPGLPSSFYGTVTLNGGNAPDGTTITAWVNGIQCGVTSTTTYLGQSVYTIDVTADDPDTPEVDGGTELDTIVFKVGVYTADQTATWHSGTNTEHNLTAQNHRPTLGTIYPTAGSCVAGQKVSFTATYPDPDGWQNIKFACFAIGQNYGGVDGLSAYYNQNNNRVYLANDEGTAWLGALPPGSPNTIENSRVILHLADMSVSGTGMTLTVNWYVTFKALTSGPKNTYHNSWDDSNLKRGWRRLGTWTVQGTNQPPVRGTVLPASGASDAGEAVTFTTTCSDANGWPQIKFVSFSIGQHYSGADGLYAYYNQNAHRFYLTNDAGTAWIGKQPPGSSQDIENSRVQLNMADTSVSATGTTLTIHWSVTFKAPVTGDKHTFMNVWDDENAKSGWRSMSDWTVNGTNQPPVAVSVLPDSGSCNPNEAVSFTTTSSDPNGWPHIKFVSFSVGSSYQGADGLKAYYNQNSHRFYLINDAGTAWIGNVPPGGTQNIENTRVILHMADTSVSGSGDTLTIDWSLTFKSSVAGAKHSYMNVRDDSDTVSQWHMMGDWTINGVGSSADPTPAGKLSTAVEPVDGPSIGSALWEVPLLEPLDEAPSEDEYPVPVLDPYLE